MTVLIGVRMFFLRRMRGGPYSKYQQECMDLTRRQVESLERIVVALEKQEMIRHAAIFSSPRL